MKIGVTLGLLHPGLWHDFAVAADELGFESLWVPEHLVFPDTMADSRYPGTKDGRPPVDPDTNLLDAPVFLASVAAATSQIKLGTYVYLLALRHPFVGARAFLTLDVVSGGRAIAGVGSGWLQAEWQAVGLDFATRGRRLDEVIDVVQRLWRDKVVDHKGTFYDFAGIHFEPKPLNPTGIPILAGGESGAALRRAVRQCDGWVSMPHTLESVKPQLDRLHDLLDDAGRDRSTFDITVSAFEMSGPEELGEWAALGVDRLIVRPYERTSTALESVRRFAAEYGVSAT